MSCSTSARRSGGDSVCSTRLTDRSALALVIATLAVMHGASGLLNVWYAAHTGWTTVLVANTCARQAAVVVLLVAWRLDTRRVHQTWGTKR